MVITLEDLGMAYRKAKVDLYYSSNTSLEAIAEYEDHLGEHLFRLLGKINGADETWVEAPDFLGSYVLAPKKIREKPRNGDGLIFSSPAEEWANACMAGTKPEAEFRVMARCSLDFHVLSTLWMLKVGHLFDKMLGTCAYGNRLRRRQKDDEVNVLSIGTFVPYLKPYRDWRDKGITTMRTALEEGKNVVAITADVSSFYHELHPGFMLEPSFIEGELLLSLEPGHVKLNRLFIRALLAWATSTPLGKGLPVGLPASAIVANVALVELDRLIEQQVVPLYYGRYVDDILLVMENGAGFSSATALWEWLFARSDGRLAWDNEAKDQIRFKPAYLTSESRILFGNGKNKVFLLKGDSGKALVGAISHQIQERASEWRAMPHLPLSADHVGTDVLAATQSDGEAADSLRKADALTMRRAGFAIRLRDFEAYERDLCPETWKEHRHAFFRAFIEHVLVLPNFFELAIYLPRVIRLATACEDFQELSKILKALDEVCNQVRDHCDIRIKALPELVEQRPPEDLMAEWKEEVFATVRESITAAFPPRLSKAGRQAWREFVKEPLSRMVLGISSDESPSVKDMQAKHARLFSYDLAHMPFRFIGLPREMVEQRGIPARKTTAPCTEAAYLLPNSVLKGIEQLARWTRFKDLPHGLLFATRPYNLPELFILNNKAAYKASERAVMQAVVLSVRGFTLGEAAPHFDKRGVLQVPDGQPQCQCGVAVSSWKTEMSSWAASVMRMPDPDTNRYERLCRLIDGVIAQPRRSRYLVLPELAMPAHWFIRIARKLQGRGISLITGIEYLHAPKARVRNQVWAALSHDGLGFPSLMIYQQDKQRPALHEEQELQRLAGLKMVPSNPRVGNTPVTIIHHGGLHFALLVCSELTDIRHRAELRGKVDVLFVPEWNQDTESFNALVESAALDMHAYIIQCNDRQYGDSRIRAPYKKSWERDILRVKGGVTDYCVIGEIDIQALRQFQSSHRSTDGLFKPVPDGFEMAYERRVLPT